VCAGLPASRSGRGHVAQLPTVSGEQAQALILEHKPDVAVLDIQMPKASGIEVTRWVRARVPGVGVLVLTAYDDEPYVLAVLQAGANGYVFKTSTHRCLIDAIHRVMAGEVYVDPAVASGEIELPAVTSEMVPALSERERAVLLDLAHGQTYRDIAERLGIGARTVETYRRRIAAKLGLRTRADFVRYALELGWLSSERDLP
jgi:DNA-binding NarL/FixJ family response regulator